MEWSDFEISRHFRLLARGQNRVRILAELNGVPCRCMRDKLTMLGLLPEKRRKRRITAEAGRDTAGRGQRDGGGAA